jgi:nitrite reductase (NADH) large subunit
MVRQALLTGPSWIKMARFLQATTLAVLLLVILQLLTGDQPAVKAGQVPVTNIFWNILVPLVPFILLAAPGLWRNICPLALINIFGHRIRAIVSGAIDHKINPKKNTMRVWFSKYGLFVGLTILFILVPARLVLFNTNCQWLGGLLLLLAAAALTAGLLLPFKSGWCSAICPVYPLERTYGSSPFILAENLLCKTESNGSSALACGGCTRNCFDLKLLAQQKKNTVLPTGKSSAAETLFIAILPGFVAAYLVLDRVAASTALPEQLVLKFFVIYLTFALLSLASGLVYLIARSISMKQSRPEAKIFNVNRTFVLVAINIYYLMAIPAFTNTIGALTGLSGIWLSVLAAALYAGIFLTSVLWFQRQSRAQRP